MTLVIVFFDNKLLFNFFIISLHRKTIFNRGTRTSLITVEYYRVILIKLVKYIMLKIK